MPNALQAFVFRALLLLGLSLLQGCFDPITLPACEHPADCPAGYVACDTGYCLLGSARCDAAAALAGDGCCFVRAGERGDDTDCVAYRVDLGEGNFAGPAIDPFDDASLVSMLVAAKAPATGGEVWLTRVARDGALVWRVPVGAGTLASLAAPVVGAAGVWVGFDGGLLCFDRVGVVRDLVGDVPLAGHLAVDDFGRLAWWSPVRQGLVVRGSAPGSREHEAVAEPDPGDVVGPVFASGSTQTVLAVGKHLRRYATADAVSTGSEELDEPARDLAVSAGRLYVLEGSLRVSAFVLAEGALARAWSASVTLPVDALGQLMQDEAGRLIVPALGGRLLVLDHADESGDPPAVSDLATPWVGGPELLLLAEGWLVQRVSAGRLHAGRLTLGPNGLEVAEAWSHDLDNEILGAPVADSDGLVLALEGAGRLSRLLSGAPGAARAGWPTMAGSATQGGVEVGVASPTTEE